MVVQQATESHESQVWAVGGQVGQPGLGLVPIRESQDWGWSCSSGQQYPLANMRSVAENGHGSETLGTPLLGYYSS